MKSILSAAIFASFAILNAAPSFAADEPNATLYAICDDSCEIAINGTIVLETSKPAELGEKEIKLAKGDLIMVRCIDIGKGYGFACAIAFKDKSVKPIISDKKNWKSYTPKEKGEWNDVKAAKTRSGVIAGTNTNWRLKITQKTEIECESIWAEVKNKPAAMCFLVYEVK